MVVSEVATLDLPDGLRLAEASLESGNARRELRWICLFKRRIPRNAHGWPFDIGAGHPWDLALRNRRTIEV